MPSMDGRNVKHVPVAGGIILLDTKFPCDIFRATDRSSTANSHYDQLLGARAGIFSKSSKISLHQSFPKKGMVHDVQRMPL